MIGYIYIMKNPCLHGILKIGFAKNVEERRKSLSNSSIPDDYEILSTYHVYDMDKAEKLTFRTLNDYRYNKKKEFFNCNFELANEVCAEVQKEVNGFCPSNVYIDIDEVFEVMLSRTSYHDVI